MRFIIDFDNGAVKRVAQVKKAEVRDAILNAAFDLFRDRGYAGTTQAQIAAGAKVAPSSLYVYFGSKLDILFAVYRPWLTERLDALEHRLRDIPDGRQRLETLLYALWRDIPAEDNGFANNLLQALADPGPRDRYTRDLLNECEDRVSQMLRQCLPPSRENLADDRNLLAHILFMAQDGFVLNRRINGPSRRMELLVPRMAELLRG